MQIISRAEKQEFLLHRESRFPCAENPRFSSMNKKSQMGSEWVIFIWRIVMIGIIVLGVIVIVGTQYKTYDIGQAEAALLSKKAIECVNEGGEMADFNAINLKECIGIKQEKYFVEASTKDKSISAGDSTLKTSCNYIKIGGNIVQKKPSCLEQSFILLENGKPAAVKLISAVEGET